MKQMKFIILLAVAASFSKAHLVPRDASESPSSVQSTGYTSGSPKKIQGTVYTFSGPGSGSKVLHLTGSQSSPKETSDSGDQSALSQLLHASTVSPSKSTAAVSITASASSSSDSHKEAVSSTTSATTSNAAGQLSAPMMMGGIAAAAIAML